MLLAYYRLYITCTLAGFLFDLDEYYLHTYKRLILDIVRKCVPLLQKSYHKTKRLQTPEEVEKYFPGFLAFIDDNEQQIPRPVDKRRCKAYYSGKKKKHTIKIQIMVNNQGIIIHKLRHKKGQRHDYIFKNIKRIIL
jgi:hypothetical protein